jgi:hypothetical protein
MVVVRFVLAEDERDRLLTLCRQRVDGYATAGDFGDRLGAGPPPEFLEDHDTIASIAREHLGILSFTSTRDEDAAAADAPRHEVGERFRTGFQVIQP